MNKKSLGAATYWILLTAVFIFFQSKHPLNSDEGVILEGAWNLMNGRHLYTDFFEIVPPGSFFLVAGMWKLIGISYWSARLLGILSVIISCVGIFVSSRIFVKNWVSYLGPVLIVLSSLGWPMINHNVYSLPLAVWSVVFFIRALSHDAKPLDSLVSGILVGLTTLFLHHKGIILFATMAGTLALLTVQKSSLEMRKKLLHYMLSSIMVSSILFIFWPADLLYTNLIEPLFSYSVVQERPLFDFSLFISIVLLSAWILRKDQRPLVRYLIAVQSILLASTLSSTVMPHLTLILFPLYILLPLVAQKLAGTVTIVRYCAVGLYALGGIMIVNSVIPAAIGTLKYPFDIFYNAPKFFVEQNCPGRYIYVGPWDPGIYFETRKLNPTPYNILLDGQQPAEHFSIAKERLITYQPSCAIINYTLAKKFGYTGNNELERYLRDAYVPLYENGDLLFATRK